MSQQAKGTHNSAEANRQKSISEFLLEDYRLKIDYLKAHFDRMWKRFQIFLGIESALFAFYFQFLFTPDGKQLQPNAWLFAVLGFLSSLLVAFFGAQDRYLVRRYRQAIEAAGTELWDYLSKGSPDVPKSYSAVGEIEPSGEKEPEEEIEASNEGGAASVNWLRQWWQRQHPHSPVDFHTTFASPTMLPAIFGYATAILWILTLVIFST
jgi:hypothetical protein